MDDRRPAPASRQPRRLAAGLIGALLWLAGCASALTTPTPLQPATTTTTPTVVTPIPTDTAVPTAAAAAAPSPTATPTPMPAAAPTAAASPSATAVAIPGLIGPDHFPENVNPLTGETVRNPALLARRPLAIKVSNAPALVRPQSGLNQADLIFEHLVEAGFTRFTAVFYSHDAPEVGSIRSGRLIDLEIPVMYDAAFAYAGSAGPVRLMFQESPFFDRIISPDFAHGGFYRIDDPDKAVEHTLFTNTDNLRFILGQRGQDVAPHFHNNMAFRAEPLDGGSPAGQIELRYASTNATWSYFNGRYWRWTDGLPHLDAADGQQLNFENVVVLAAHHQETGILEQVPGGHFSIQIQIWGEGPVSIFRDGQRYDGRWRRAQPQEMLTFYDRDGQILPLAPGNTFFQLVPLGFDRLTVRP